MYAWSHARSRGGAQPRLKRCAAVGPTAIRGSLRKRGCYPGLMTDALSGRAESGSRDLGAKEGELPLPPVAQNVLELIGRTPLVRLGRLESPAGAQVWGKAE